jgi:carboxymethylenebutenolidase
MPQQETAYSLDQIGYTPVRFNSTGIFETHKDRMVDPYAETRMHKVPQVEGIQYAPQTLDPAHQDTIKRLPCLVVLHDQWGLTSPIQDLAKGLACHGYVVLIPNLYGRQGGMVTANEEVAQALMERLNEQQALQDINACFEVLNCNLTEDTLLERTVRNAHAVVGFGMGGTLAIKTATQRRRLKAAVAIGGTLPSDPETAQGLYCPLMLQQAGQNPQSSPEDLEHFCHTAKEAGKIVDVHTYTDASPGFWYPNSPNYQASDMENALQRSLDFISNLIKNP